MCSVEHELRQRAVHADHRARSTTKRAPTVWRRFRSPSPVSRRESRNARAAGSEVARVAPAADLDVVGLVAAFGHLGRGRFGMRISMSRSAGILGWRPRRSAGDLGLLLGHQRAQAFELGIVAAALAAPTSFEARFCAAWAVSAARILARRASSSAEDPDDIGPKPRRASAASKAAGFSRMARMSCMVGPATPAFAQAAGQTGAGGLLGSILMPMSWSSASCTC
jgi:hypothetical protein